MQFFHVGMGFKTPVRMHSVDPKTREAREVIRLELPGGDPLRGMPPCVDGVSVRFDALNRHKQVRELDIKSRAGRDELFERVRNADVFLHNWAPGKAAELGLDSTDLMRINPALVFAYAGGWGHDRPGEPLPGTDFMVQAWSGVGEQIGQASSTTARTSPTLTSSQRHKISSSGASAAQFSGKGKAVSRP